MLYSTYYITNDKSVCIIDSSRPGGHGAVILESICLLAKLVDK